MTDKEIIQALEYCSENCEENCNKCPYQRNCVSADKDYLVRDALDLINRQQTQLDNYSHNVRNMIKDFNEQYKIIKQQQAENEGLRDEIEHLHEIIDDLYETIEE